MYSPKIRDVLIPRIYRMAKAAKVPMTRWVNQVLERALTDQGSALKGQRAISRPQLSKKEKNLPDDQGEEGGRAEESGTLRCAEGNR